jgi:hypothetical protein
MHHLALQCEKLDSETHPTQAEFESDSLLHRLSLFSAKIADEQHHTNMLWLQQAHLQGMTHGWRQVGLDSINDWTFDGKPSRDELTYEPTAHIAHESVALCLHHQP